MRWPLHPLPLPAEALSSWLRRLAKPYDLTTEQLLADGLGHVPLTDRQLDTDPPEHLLDLLADRTGVGRARIGRMTLGGLLPPEMSGAGRSLFESHAQHHSILLPRAAKCPKSVKDDWHAWETTARYRLPWVCPACFEQTHERHIKLTWLFPIAASCPTHNTFLVTRDLVGIIDLRPNKPKKREVPPSVATLDRCTEAAIVTGRVELPHVGLSAATWFQLLRVVLDELNTPLASTGSARHFITSIWRTSRITTRARASARAAYEDLKANQQTQFLEAAAVALQRVISRSDEGHGEDVGLLGGIAPDKAARTVAHADAARRALEPEPPRCARDKTTRHPTDMAAALKMVEVGRITFPTEARNR